MFQTTAQPITEKELLNLILNDRVNEALQAIDNFEENSDPLRTLLKQAAHRPNVFPELTAPYPTHFAISPSYTCNIGCEMCNAGFHIDPQPYDGRDFLSPQSWEEILPWIEDATHWCFVGVGETLDSPFLNEFLEKGMKKYTLVTTSGVGLTRRRLGELMNRKLDCLQISFEGDTEVGHGSGKPEYSKNMWEKIELVHQVKQEQSSITPHLELHITVNLENLEQMNGLFERAQSLGVEHIVLFPMSINRDATGRLVQNVYEASFAVNYEACRAYLNEVADRWRELGLRISFNEYQKLEEAATPCSYVDNTLIFSGLNVPPKVCCGSLDMPHMPDETGGKVFWNSFPFRYLRFLMFCQPEQRQPRDCQECLATHPARYFETMREEMGNQKEERAALYGQYRVASEARRSLRYEEARLQFLKLQDEDLPQDLKSGVWFHLGELEVIRGELTAARNCFENAIRENFSHKKAFAFLYLVYRILGAPDYPERQPRTPLRIRS